MGDCDLRRWSSDPHEAAAGRGLELPPGARLLQLRPFNPIKHCRKTLLHTPAKIHDPASQLSTDGWKKPEHKHCCFYPENSGRLLKQQRPCQYVVSNTAAFPAKADICCTSVSRNKAPVLSPCRAWLTITSICIELEPFAEGVEKKKQIWKESEKRNKQTEQQ